MRSLFLLCCVLFVTTLSAQVSFSSLPFSQALQDAQAQGKLIFLQFEAANCEQCNDVANKGLKDKIVAERINQTFYCLKVDAHYPDRVKIAHDYNIDADKGFGTLFLDNNGTLVHKFLQTTSRSKDYLDQTEIALSKAGESLGISELEREYKKGNRSYGFLQALLLKRRTLNLPTDSLLEEYIYTLPADSLETTNTIYFIAQMTPYIDSKPYQAMYEHKEAFNRAWYTMPLQMRVQINNVMTRKSMDKAIKERNQAYAIRVASYAQATNGGNYLPGAKAFDKNMLRYFDETNDTATYFRKAVAFYERYYLVVSVDSIKRLDFLAIARMMNNPAINKDTVRNGNKMRVTTTVPFRPAGQFFANDLNEGAYKFYQRTDNPYLLSVATEWVEKALEFYKTPAILDTYARLLYKQGKNEKAIEAMNEAIALHQKNGFPTDIYDATLDAIKHHKKLKD
jgi:hypothetical protein